MLPIVVMDNWYKMDHSLRFIVALTAVDAIAAVVVDVDGRAEDSFDRWVRLGVVAAMCKQYPLYYYCCYS